VSAEVELKDVERLHLEPGDVLVLTSRLPLDDATYTKISLQLRQQFGADVPIAILDNGLRLQVVNKADLEPKL